MKSRRILSFILCFAVVLTVFMVRPINADATVKKADKEAFSSVFDADYYYLTYPDVALLCGYDYNALLNHFMEVGVYEGRNASATFNPQAYRNRYPDLYPFFVDDMAAYCQHYATYGILMGLDGSSDELFAPVLTTTAAGLIDGQLLGTCTTNYKAKIARATNVELAAMRINGVIIEPGDSFSFSETILPRTAENGYVVAPVFVNKKVSKGIGGGICQVSSTLYAAMLFAGLPATERHPHSLPVSYLPAGFDATIAGNTLDLKFDNIYSQPLMIAASANQGTLTVSLYLLNQ